MTFPFRSMTITDSLISSVADGSPRVQALTLAYAKQHIRALGDADDDLTSVRIDAAASYFEEQTGRQLLTATREAWLDAFPFAGASGTAARIELPHPPLQKVLDVTYIDSTGVRRSFTDGASPATPHYTWSAPVGPYARRGVVEPLAGQVWPTVTAQTGAVRITYRCGYGDTADAVPALARGILCYLVGHFDTFLAAVHQGQVVELPYGVCELMDGFKYSAYPQQLLRPLAWPVPGMPPA